MMSQCFAVSLSLHYGAVRSFRTMQPPVVHRSTSHLFSSGRTLHSSISSRFSSRSHLCSGHDMSLLHVRVSLDASDALVTRHALWMTKLALGPHTLSIDELVASFQAFVLFTHIALETSSSDTYRSDILPTESAGQ